MIVLSSGEVGIALLRRCASSEVIPAVTTTSARKTPGSLRKTPFFMTSVSSHLDRLLPGRVKAVQI